MVEQQKLFYDDWYDAAHTVVMALGGKKEVGHMLWPQKDVEAAARLLMHCLDRDRNEKLDPEQICLLRREGRKVNCHALAYFEAQDSNYKYEPIEPEDERAKLQRQYIAAVKHLSKLTEDMEAIDDKRSG